MAWHHVEAAEEAKVDVHDDAIAPVLEQVFPVGLDRVENLAVEKLSSQLESTLRRARRDSPTREVAVLLSCGPVDRVSFGHQGRASGM
jgi:pantothenate synthetase